LQRLSELFCAMLCMIVVHSGMQPREQFLNLRVFWGLGFFGMFFMFNILCMILALV